MVIFLLHGLYICYTLLKWLITSLKFWNKSIWEMTKLRKCSLSIFDCKSIWWKLYQVLLWAFYCYLLFWKILRCSMHDNSEIYFNECRFIERSIPRYMLYTTDLWWANIWKNKLTNRRNLTKRYLMLSRDLKRFEKWRCNICYLLSV